MSTSLPSAAPIAPLDTALGATPQREPATQATLFEPVLTAAPLPAPLAEPAIPAGTDIVPAASGTRRLPVVLSVDDDPDALAVLQLCLTVKGFNVITASNGAQALRLAAMHRPDLIVADCIMPGMSGLELCRLLRSSPETRDIPIVMCSGTCLEAAERAPVDRFVTKPADIDQLAALIDGLLGRSPAQNATRSLR